MARPYMTPDRQAQRQGGSWSTTARSRSGSTAATAAWPQGISVADLALELGLEPTRVAVERNLEIVPRSTLGRGARSRMATIIEIVTFVGGG